MSHRPRLFAVTLAALTVLCGADSPGRPLNLYFIDVMGGAATLIVTPEGESLLIDSGWPGLNDRDPTRIEHILKRVAGREGLDHLATTHWHTDHYGGVAGLVKRVRIGKFWDRGLPDPAAPDGDKANFPDGPKDDEMGKAYLQASRGRRQSLKAGDTIPLKGSVSILVLAASGNVIEIADAPANPLCAAEPEDKAADPSDNAKSLAFRLRMGKFDFLDCGDLTWNIEKRLVCPKDLIGPIDLFQVTHHGMATSNHPTLLRTIAPTVTVMDNGPRKGGDAAVVRLLRTIPSVQAAYQLHKNAATGPADNTDPNLIANTDPEGGEFIHVSVPPGGEQFTVRIGTGGPSQTFPTH